MKASPIVILIGIFITALFVESNLMAYQSGRPKTSGAKGSEYFRQAYESTFKDIERIKINRRWAEYYLSVDKKDSAIIRLEQNLTYDFLDRPADLKPELARSYVLLDRVLDNTQRLESSRKLLTAAIPILEESMPKSEDLAWAYLRYGIRLWYSEQYDEAETWWQKAYDHARRFNHEQIEIKALHHQGFIYTKNLKLKLSRSHYKFLISLIERSSQSTPEDYILALNALGSAFNWDEKLDSALFYYQKGLAALQQHESDTTLFRMVLTNKALIKNNIGKTYLKKKDYSSAASFLEEAISINQELFGEKSTELIRSLRDLGKAYQFLGYSGEAKRAFLAALDISKHHQYDLPKSYSRLADYYAEERLFNLSLLYYDSAVISTGTFLEQKKDQYIHGVNLYTTIYGHSKVLASSTDVDIEDLNKLFARFKTTVEFFYGRVESETFFQWIPLILENLYVTYSKLYNQQSDAALLSTMWEIIELNKAVKLRKQLNDVDAYQFGLPKKVIERGKTLRNLITELMVSIEPGDQGSPLLFLNRAYDDYLKELENDYPRYYSLKNQLKITSLSKIRKGLEKGTMLINFLEGQKEVYAIRVTSKAATTQTIIKEGFAVTVARHNEAILSRNKPGIKLNAEKLRAQLALDFTDARHFRIIPDGLLWDLNFAAVMNIDSEKQRDKYSFSFNYFAGRESAKGSSLPDNILAFAYSQANSVSTQPQLRNPDKTIASIPGTSTELASISKIWDGEYYYAQNANETTFKQKGSKYGLLHLAIHGFMNQADPENSYLQFAAPDSLNDGKLHVYEIYNLDLNADLAVLSACHSGQGKVVAGEGMMSLGRAFAYAGVRSLLISRWEVSDYSAPHLMKYFYEGLKEGMYKSEALKYAQTRYLENHSDALTSSPFYWSSFYILGDDNPISKPRADFEPWMIWLMIAAVSSAGLLYRRKKGISREQNRP
ncbi:MAG: hypothetical protein Roseis2KO_19120 [Roseivirga sp.]